MIVPSSPAQLLVSAVAPGSSRKHRRDQVPAFMPRCEQHTTDVQSNAGKQHVRGDRMEVSDPFHAPESIRRIQPASKRHHTQQAEQGHHHPRTERIVSTVHNMT